MSKSKTPAKAVTAAKVKAAKTKRVKAASAAKPHGPGDRTLMEAFWIVMIVSALAAVWAWCR